jgi:predicted small lipoprotein YifL
MHLRITLSLLSCALLGACGQRGALYLPEQDRNVVVTPAPAPADTAPTPETEEQRRNSTTPAR